MTPDQLRRRDAVMERIDALAAQETKGRSDALKRERIALIGELTALAQEAARTKGDRVEQSRTWRYIASAYYDLGAGIDLGPLGQAKDAYDRAEALLAGLSEPGERARLDLFYGSTLRGLSGGENRGLLEQAITRYRRAREVLSGGPPQLLSYLDQQLSTAEFQLSLCDGVARAAKGLAQLNMIDAIRTRNGAGPTPESERHAAEMLK